jgi:E3 ubiquitin-protein ligase RBBP6
MASGTIHYKFKSAKTFDTLAFDGSFIAVSELKRLISEKKGLGKDHACELVLTNAQDGNEYDDESALVWKNTSVIVRRVPSMKQAAVGSAQGSEVAKKVVYVAPPDASQIPSRNVSRRLQMNLNKITKTDAGEEDGGGDNPLANMAREQAQQWESEKMAANAAAASAGRGGRGGGRGAGRRSDGPPGPGYICFKCNQGGHWIQDCPLAADTTVEIVRTKHAYGIPQTKLEATTGGILVAPTGESAQMVAAEDEFQKMFGFLNDRGKEPLALGNGEETLALGDGGEGEGGETGAPPAEEPVEEAAPVLPPGFVPPMPMGPPPPGAQKRDLAPVMDPMTNIDELDPMGIMSMDTSIEGLKKMAEDLKKQKDLLDAGNLWGTAPPMTAPPMPAMPPPPSGARDVPSGPPVFEEEEDTVVMLAGEDDPEPEPQREVEEDREPDADNPRRGQRAPPPPPAMKSAPPPPPPVIPENIAKAHEEAMKSRGGGRRTRHESREPGPRFGAGAPSRRRGRAESREPTTKRDDSRDAPSKRARGTDTPQQQLEWETVKRENGSDSNFSRDNSADDLTKAGGTTRPRRSRGGRNRGGRGRSRGGSGGTGVMARIG